MTDDEIISKIVSRHFKRLEGYLLDLNLPRLAYIAISKEFRFLEDDLQKAMTYQGEDLKNLLTSDER